VVDVAFKTLDKGARSGVRAYRAEAVLSAEMWDVVWRMHVGGGSDERAAALPPYVDFTQSMVIAFFMGEQPTSGYGASIVSVAAREDRLVVEVETEVPPRGAAALYVLTQPFHLVEVPRLSLPVEFVVRRAAEDDSQSK
jgi:hypothetical protein